MYFLDFVMHFDRDQGLDKGRLVLRYVDKDISKCRTVKVWSATSSSTNKQYVESFHEKGGLIPPEYRVPGLQCWRVSTTPIHMPGNPGVKGSFYKMDPHEVRTDKGGVRGDFGIHEDANATTAPGSLGCPVMNKTNFDEFEEDMSKLNELGYRSIPVFVTYS